MNDSSSGQNRDRPQFSLRALLLITAGVVVYVSVAVLVVRNGRFLDVVADLAGIFALGCGVFAFASFGMLVVNLTREPANQLSPIVLLLAAIAYPPVNVVLFIVTLTTDRTAIFDDGYLIVVVLVGPAVMLGALAVFAGFMRRVGWLGWLGYSTWIASVAFAHVWVIAAAASSV